MYYLCTIIKNDKDMTSIDAQFHNDLSSGKLLLSRTSSASGYIRKKDGCRISSYNGRFGVGYTVEFPNVMGFISHGKRVKSMNFHEIRYYIFE